MGVVPYKQHLSEEDQEQYMDTYYLYNPRVYYKETIQEFLDKGWTLSDI